jgi:hypothetical protein
VRENRKETADLSTPPPGIFRFGGVGDPRSAFLNESHRRGRVQSSVVGNPGTLRSKHIFLRSGKGAKYAPSAAKSQTDLQSIMDGLKAVPFTADFISLGGPQAHDHSGRDGKFVTRKLRIIQWMHARP